MRMLFDSGKLLLLDMASTLFFLALYLLTGNITLAIVLGMVLGVVQIGWQYFRKKPIDAMQWMSLFLVLAGGATALITHDARFVMVKPTLIYAIVGTVMLRRGWMNRYMPAVAVELMADVALIFGYIWSALMFFSAGLNLYLALTYTPVVWGTAMSIWGIASKGILFLFQFALMRTI